MRLTVTIDDDVAHGVEILRREGMTLSQALNLLARRGMTKEVSSTTVRYQRRTSRIGLKVDVTNVADLLDLLDLLDGDRRRKTAVVCVDANSRHYAAAASWLEEIVAGGSCQPPP